MASASINQSATQTLVPVVSTLPPAPLPTFLGLPNEILEIVAAAATEPSAVVLALTCNRLYDVVLHQRRRPILKKVCRKPRHYSPRNGVKQSQFDELMRLLWDEMPHTYGLCRGTRTYINLPGDDGEQGGCECPVNLLRRQDHEVIFRGPWYETQLVTYDCCAECQMSWRKRTGGWETAVVLEGMPEHDGEVKRDSDQASSMIRVGSKLGKVKLLGTKMQVKKKVNEPNYSGILDLSMGRALRYEPRLEDVRSRFILILSG